MATFVRFNEGEDMLLLIPQGEVLFYTLCKVGFLQKYDDHVSTFSFPPLQSAVQAVCSAGMELKNIKEFYRQWKEIG